MRVKGVNPFFYITLKITSKLSQSRLYFEFIAAVTVKCSYVVTALPGCVTALWNLICRVSCLTAAPDSTRELCIMDAQSYFCFISFGSRPHHTDTPHTPTSPDSLLCIPPLATGMCLSVHTSSWECSPPRAPLLVSILHNYFQRETFSNMKDVKTTQIWI